MPRSNRSSRRAGRGAYRLASALVAVVVFAAPLRAEAQTTPERWYGWQMLPSEAVGWAGVAYTLATKRLGPATALGGAALLLGGPIVHWVHGSGARGAGSLGMRVGALLVGAVVGGLTVRLHWPRHPLVRAIVLVTFTIGTFAAVQVLDNVLLARERDPTAAGSSSGAARAMAPLTLRF